MAMYTWAVKEGSAANVTKRPKQNNRKNIPKLIFSLI
jgi:hypothetical protein